MQETEGEGAAGDRGRRIQRRLDAIGMSLRQFHDKTGLDRQTITRAIRAEGNVRPSTYGQIEAALDRLEAELGIVPEDIDPGDLIEYRLESAEGVAVVIKGPLRDAAALEESVTRLLRRMQDET